MGTEVNVLLRLERSKCDCDCDEYEGVGNLSGFTRIENTKVGVLMIKREVNQDEGID